MAGATTQGLSSSGHAGCHVTRRCGVAGLAAAPCRRRRIPAGAHRPLVAVAAAAGVRGVATDLATLRSAPPPLSEEAVGRAVEEAFQETFWGSLAAPRVLESYRCLLSGKVLEREWPGQGHQLANSFLEGLSAVACPDITGPGYEWLQEVERQADTILREFQEVAADAELASKGNNIWVPAARGDAAGYGDDWRTLVLQDRGYWDARNAALFPQTAAVFQDLKAPTLEVFFARQPPGTGIKSHTDYVNFVQTSHLGLIIPEGDCWYKVGDHVRKWQNGKMCTWDTSFMHETRNDTDSERIVLIMRHWHPEVTPLERLAIGFLFDCLDAPTLAGIRNAQTKVQAHLGGAAHTGGRGAKGKGKGKKKGKGAAASGKGFGARPPS